MLKSCSAQLERPDEREAQADTVAVDSPAALWTLLEDARGGLHLRGELDFTAVPAVAERLTAIDWNGELDCSGVTFIDAAAVHLLVTLDEACLDRGTRLAIVDPSRCVLRILELTGLETVLYVRTGAASA